MNRFQPFFYSILHVFFYTLSRLLFRLKVIGRDHIPDTGPVIVAANHASYADIPILGCSMKRQANYMAKEELFRNPIIGTFYRMFGGFPIRRFHSKEKLGEAVNRLNAGGLLIMYPEGARTPDGRLQGGMPGIGLLVAQTGVPVVPAYISNTHKIMPVGTWWVRPHRVTVIFGKPMYFNELVKSSGLSRDLYRAISDRVMGGIRDLSVQVEAIEKGNLRETA
jgi:1-acyl-sn-glycerol-3-phosphate acyltransferase